MPARKSLFALVSLISTLVTSVGGEGEEKTWNECSIKGGTSASDFATELWRPGIESTVDVEVDSDDYDYDDTRCETAYNEEGDPMSGEDLGKLVIEKRWSWSPEDYDDDLDYVEDTYCKLLCERKEGCVAWEYRWGSVRGYGGASCYGYSELYYEPELRNVGNCGSSRTASAAGLCTPLPNDKTMQSPVVPVVTAPPPLVVAAVPAPAPVVPVVTAPPPLVVAAVPAPAPVVVEALAPAPEMVSVTVAPAPAPAPAPPLVSSARTASALAAAAAALVGFFA